MPATRQSRHHRRAGGHVKHVLDCISERGRVESMSDEGGLYHDLLRVKQESRVEMSMKAERSSCCFVWDVFKREHCSRLLTTKRQIKDIIKMLKIY